MNSIIDAQNDLYIEVKKLLPEIIPQTYSHGKYSNKAMADLINSSKSDLLEKKIRAEERVYNFKIKYRRWSHDTQLSNLPLTSSERYFNL